ncbi:hypothetical protein HPC49_10290 [Pyxidicoccus fallax]|uniref:Immunity MXAN-0049 protein domain-containing protein n=1 Tax=Pyxidicoccus fallax TaxID=394095 RepID=A0A848LIY6_9BACT|nr:DUF1629 domain-containing protein [Pyxidicoccus fallax]NMO17680.1 hypothetical protein [Pyxidicoccus fallax]NPC78631.1 hypothetical protein [Pyxidicoccus fallax]
MTTDNRMFWMLDTISNPGAVIETYVEGAPSKWRLFKNQPQAAQFPAGATLRFSRDFPKHRKLFDFVANTMSLIIASKKVKDILDSVGVDNCEYLPVAVKDHKDKVVGPEYFIIHPLGGEDGIDLEKSVYDKDPFDESEIQRVRTLVLKKELISPRARLFRFKPLMRKYVVDQTVADALKAGKVTGYRLLQADGWDGSFTNLEA